MSVKNLLQSFQDRDRVQKIQGLLNECMTFLDDELSLITDESCPSRWRAFSTCSRKT